MLNDILKEDMLTAVKNIREKGKNVDQETIDLVNKIFFSFEKVGKNVDVVLVLGGLQEKRAIVGSNLGIYYNIPVIFSGGVYHSCFDMTESSYYKKIGLENGLNDSLIYLENESTNTYENFLYSFEIIKKFNHKNLINIAVVSSSIHLPRSIFTGNEIIEKNNYNINLIPVPSDGIKNSKENWMKHVETRRSVSNELRKLLNYKYKNSLIVKYNRIDNTMKNMVSENVFPGATYALVNKNYALMGVCGCKSLYPKEQNNLNTLYDMASLTKVIVTNTIILRLMQSGKINLNDKIGKYLKEYDYLDVTIYHLVTHSAGLKPSFDNASMNTCDDFSNELKNIKLEYEPGTKSVYSDIGFILLGMIIEKVYNMSLDKVADIEIFKPLSMRKTTFNPNIEYAAPTEKTINRGLVRGKVHDETAYYSGKILGHAGLFCDINDVSKFVKMILNDGMIGKNIYLEKKYIDMLFHPEIKDIDNVDRSIGWIVGRVNSTGNMVSKMTISHTGFTGTSIIIDRLNKIGIIVLSNRVHPTRDNKLLISKRKEIVNSVYQKVYIKKKY